MTHVSPSGPDPATASEIREIVGPLEDEVVVKILDIGATASEVLDAYTWFRSDERRERLLEHELHGRTARVFEVLEEDYPEPDRS
ncbi:hypothetical protein GALL_415910 [mine drainage metagenome]|jgi:hypothetical protein|uniref:Uncharacterized protein n=1 Tax=mine drainage metagenome TaxID=410659 RepID=A0A1J5PZ90_9ZZZZ